MSYSYAFRRIAYTIPQLLGVIVICFFLIHLAPGDLTLILGGEFAPPEYQEMLRQRLGLDKSVPEQFFIYLGSILQGDLGYSWVFNVPVLDLIIERLFATLLLAGSSLILGFTLGILLGILAAEYPYSRLDNLISTFSILGYSFPHFWLGIMLMMLFGLYLGWLPIQGMSTLGVHLTLFESFIDVMRHLLLPMIVMSTNQLAIYTRMMRTSMIEVLSQDYIDTAKAKGSSHRDVIYRHALKNALLPVVTILGINIGNLLTGAVLTETVFSWPGIGRLMYDAIGRRDYPVIMGIFIMISIMVIIANLLTDLFYVYIDPRIQYK